VTGSAIAIPLLGAASANAADGTTWDKVAECESGGIWSADTGNGYHGGLQISQADWAKYGGTQYAPSADRASRSQQIAVAEKILADQGTTPWATCALLSGLTSNTGSVDVDTGVGGSGHGHDSGDSSGSSDTSDSSGLSDSLPSSDANSGSGDSLSSDSTVSATPGSAGDATADPGTATGSPETKTPKSDKSPSIDTGASQGDTASPPAIPPVGEADNSQQPVASWSLVDTGSLGSGGRHRGGSADESAANGQNATSSGRHASPGAGAYIVREGDTLASIADSLDVDGGWHALYSANKKAIGADPNHINAGQTLKVGTETDAD
jgi:hypothetical protein